MGDRRGAEPTCRRSTEIARRPVDAGDADRARPTSSRAAPSPSPTSSARAQKRLWIVSPYFVPDLDDGDGAVRRGDARRRRAHPDPARSPTTASSGSPASPTPTGWSATTSTSTAIQGLPAPEGHPGGRQDRRRRHGELRQPLVPHQFRDDACGSRSDQMIKRRREDADARTSPTPTRSSRSCRGSQQPS